MLLIGTRPARSTPRTDELTHIVANTHTHTHTTERLYKPVRFKLEKIEIYLDGIIRVIHSKWNMYCKLYCVCRLQCLHMCILCMRIMGQRRCVMKSHYAWHMFLKDIQSHVIEYVPNTEIYGVIAIVCMRLTPVLHHGNTTDTVLKQVLLNPNDLIDLRCYTDNSHKTRHDFYSTLCTLVVQTAYILYTGSYSIKAKIPHSSFSQQAVCNAHWHETLLESISKQKHET